MKKLSIIIIVLGIISCRKDINSTSKTPATAAQNKVVLSDIQLKSIKLSVSPVQNRKISKTIKVTGKIDVSPQKLISISIPLGGYLKTIAVFPGTRVRKGETIATLEDFGYIQLQQDYLTTKNKLELAENEYKRQKELNENEASSDKVLQQAKSEYQSLKITLNALSEKLKLLQINPQGLSEQNISKSITLRAPFDAFVSKVNVNTGKYVSPPDVLFELIDPDDIHLNINVFEKDLLQLAIGQNAAAYSNTNPQKKYPCKIVLINRSISADQTAEVHATFDQHDHNLVPGMYMNADILLHRKDAYVVPEQAVVSFEGKTYLFIETGKQTYEMVDVVIGENENGWVEITNTTLAGEKIVWDGAYSLLMELKNIAD